MAPALRPIGHEDRLSLVDHLDELRNRLIACVVTLLAAFALCFWQSDAILDAVTKPVRETQNLETPSRTSQDPLEQSAFYDRKMAEALTRLAPALTQTGASLDELGEADNLTAAQRAQLQRATALLDAASRSAAEAGASIPRDQHRNLVTLGVTEPFTATITISFYAALLLSLPMLLYQLYAFILPAFSPRERTVALPLMLMVPALFIAGAAFGYFVVLERAVAFLQNFNDDSFDILLQARDYFKFSVLFVAGVGMLFQIPVAVLAVTRAGIMTPRQLAKNRGYVILVMAILAAVLTPTPDPITMLLAMGPLVVLFELSILLARWIEHVRPVSIDEDDDTDGWDGDDDPIDDDDPPPGDDDAWPDVDDDETWEETDALDVAEPAPAGAREKTLQDHRRRADMLDDAPRADPTAQHGD